MTAYPVSITLADRTVLAAYDITIYDGRGQIFQPAEDAPVQVSISLPADDAVDIYHLADAAAQPEYVDTVQADGDAVDFLAQSFSIYVVAQIDNPFTFQPPEGAIKLENEGTYTCLLYTSQKHRIPPTQ